MVVIAQLLLIAGLLQSRSRLRRADTTIRAREASLRTSYERIRQMAGRLINAQEAARAEIARDLHDDVCQRLTSVSMGVGSLKNATGTLEDPKMQEGISELDRETRDAFESIRRLSHDLHPATLRLLGLAPCAALALPRDRKAARGPGPVLQCGRHRHRSPRRRGLLLSHRAGIVA